MSRWRVQDSLGWRERTGSGGWGGAREFRFQAGGRSFIRAFVLILNTDGFYQEGDVLRHQSLIIFSLLPVRLHCIKSKSQSKIGVFLILLDWMTVIPFITQSHE